ncbi:HalOD1 output domain-containing protein [Halomicroarcula sp. GCM10025817]|uniref:HalOD1 output domain-containing protein n=1 Tax=Haloarcula TaxID=2237 RepID=UPI0023E8DA32|nr:HalOD1 output domain-containing protein [Halomicroarcula sp. SYNS111]
MRQLYGDNIVVEIVEQFMKLDGCGLTELPPLQETIDVDALESLLTSADDSDLIVQFEYNDATVSLTGEGSVIIHPLEE